LPPNPLLACRHPFRRPHLGELAAALGLGFPVTMTRRREGALHTMHRNRLGFASRSHAFSGSVAANPPDLNALADQHSRTALRGLLTPAIGDAEGWRTK
jgi:hypothetical protein